MRNRTIIGTTLSITEIGFGAASLGNLYRETSSDEAEQAVDAAWATGIRYFDTAPHYGLGLSERRLGAALAKYPRDEFVISTKVGRLLVANPHPTGLDAEGFVVPDDVVRQWDFSAEGIKRSLDESLTRLQMDHVDVVYVHDPDQAGPNEGRTAMRTLIALRGQGIVSAVGVGTNSGSEVARVFDETDADIAMLAGRYTLLEQGALGDALRSAAARRKSVVAVGVFNSGILATDSPAATSNYDYGPAPELVVSRARKIAEVCAQFGVSLPAAAIAFPLMHPNIVNVTIGMRNAAQVQRNVELAKSDIPLGLWDALRGEGLL